MKKVNYFGAFETLGWLSFCLVRPAFILVDTFLHVLSSSCLLTDTPFLLCIIVLGQ